MELDILNLGLIEYERAWKLQDEYAAEIAAGRRLPTLLLLEHPHTFTFGRKGHVENLLWSPEEMTRRGVSVHWVDRGGDVTYHGPGQLVGYPLIPLRHPPHLHPWIMLVMSADWSKYLSPCLLVLECQPSNDLG